MLLFDDIKPGSRLRGLDSAGCSATIWIGFVLPHPGILPSGPGIASPGCSRRRVTLSIGSRKTRFPVRPASLLSRPDLAPPKPRRAAEGTGRSGATWSHAQRTLSREHGEDGEHLTFPEVSTVAHSAPVGGRWRSVSSNMKPSWNQSNSSPTLLRTPMRCSACSGCSATSSARASPTSATPGCGGSTAAPMTARSTTSAKAQSISR